MPDTTPEQNLNLAINQSNNHKPLKIIKALILTITFSILILALYFGIMNYLNILPISQLYPKQFGFLPHQYSYDMPKTISSNINLIT